VRQILTWTFVGVLMALPSPARAVSVTFILRGNCAPVCSEVSLAIGQHVSGTLRIDTGFLSITEGASAEVTDADLLELEFTFESQLFRDVRSPGASACVGRAAPRGPACGGTHDA
jgi:hypothetical protein